MPEYGMLYIDSSKYYDDKLEKFFFCFILFIKKYVAKKSNKREFCVLNKVITIYSNCIKKGEIPNRFKIQVISISLLYVFIK